jgi:bacterioferritin
VARAPCKPHDLRGPQHPELRPEPVDLYQESRELAAVRRTIATSTRNATSALIDVDTLRNGARKELERSGVTHAYKSDRETVLRLLNDSLATEIVCVLRYKRHYYMATGINAHGVAAEFLEHAAEEQSHADLLAERIVQLKGAPNLDPEHLSARSHARYIEGTDLADMIREDLIAERIAIDSYAEMIGYVGDRDPTTRRMLESILASEEEHAEDLISLLRGQCA